MVRLTALLLLLFSFPCLAQESCPPPLPPQPESTKATWRHKSTKLLTVASGSPRHRGQDVVAGVGGEQVLVAKFAYGEVDKDLKDEWVDIYVQRRPPCGAWEKLGEALTSKDGEHGTMAGVEDDGGRVFYSVPTDKRLPAGRYPVRMRVRNDSSEASLYLYVAAPGTEVVVFDIDGTLTVDDAQITKEVLAHMAQQDYDPKMHADGVSAVRAWAGRKVLPIYLTGRPDLLAGLTRAWLVKRGFPPGPLHLTDTLSQVVPASKGVARYKAAFLKRLLAAGVRIVAAYGNAETDIEAYADAGVDPAVTHIIGKHGGKEGTVAIDSYTTHLPTIRQGPPASVPFPKLERW